jgi:EcsC protein family
VSVQEAAIAFDEDGVPVEPDDLEVDAEPGSGGGRLAASATRLVERLMDIGIDGRGPIDSAQLIADKALSAHPDADRAIDVVVGKHLKIAAAGGFVTGLGGFVTLPVALPVNVAEFYLLATRMVASIACLRGYDLRKPEVRSAVLLALVGADADDLLRKAGVAPGGRLAALAAERLPGPALMMVNKGVGFRLLSTIGRKGLQRFGKAVPLVGGAVGAGVDAFLLRRIADHARHEFPPAMALTTRST